MTLEFRVLGPLEVRDGDRPVPLGPPKRRALLAVLLVHLNVPVSVDALIDALWGESPPTGAVTVVHGHVSQLRKVLGPGVLMTRPPGYALHAGDAQVDAQRFERLVRAARTVPDLVSRGEQLRGALRLWRGDALADFGYSAFAQAYAGRLEELRLIALEAVIEADLAVGRYLDVIGELQALVAQHPLRERFRCQLMLALYRAGRQTEALAVYRDVRRVLVDDLGVEPGAELQARERAILRHDKALDSPPARPSRASNLPQPPTRLIGRDDELASVCESLRGGTRLLTLTGPGGTGKSRLGLAVAEALADDFRDGVFLVELAAIQDPQRVASAIVEVLGVRPGHQDPAVALRGELRDKQVLLLLDNFENVLAAADLVAELLEVARDLRVLVTSRVPLHLLAEERFDVGPLALPDPAEDVDVERLSRSDAVMLLVERARAVQPGFALTAENAPAVAETCARLDGLPLALELAAPWMKVLTAHGLLRRLASRLELLTRGARDLPERQRTLRATIDWSCRLLAPDEQRLFARLGVFTGGFTMETVESVVGDGSGSVLAGLATLLDHSLLQELEPTGPIADRRFTMLETIREYALDLLRAGGDQRAVERRHAECFCELVERAEPQLWGPQQAAWVQLLECEHHNVRAALAWSRTAGEKDLTLRLAAAAAHFWYIRGHLAEGRAWVERALADGADRPAPLRAAALRAAAILARFQGDYAQARTWATDAVALSRQLSDTHGVVRALSDLANVAVAEGRYGAAAVLHDESITLARAVGGTDLAISLTNRADLALNQGDRRLVATLSEEALQLFRSAGNAEGEAVSLFNLGSAAMQEGRLPEALRHFVESLLLSERIGYDHYVANCLTGLAAVIAAAGDAAGGTRLVSAADHLYQVIAASRDPGERDQYGKLVASLRAGLGEDAFEREWVLGRAMERGQVVAMAVAGGQAVAR